MKKAFSFVLVFSCLTALFFVGCRKKETVEVDNETQSAVDNAVADQEYMSIVPAVNNHAINTKGTGTDKGKMTAPPCDTLTWLNRATADTSLNANNKYLVAPMYELNLLTNCGNSFTDGKVRTGKWTIRVTGPLKIAGSQMIIKLVNHKAAITGTSTIIGYSCDSIVVTTINSSTLSNTFNVKLINGVCLSSAWNIKYNLDRTITTYPKGNPVNSDPVVEVFGTSNGVNRVGKPFQVVIPQVTPLIKRKTCKFIEKGILELTPEGFKTRTIDFGFSTGNNPYGGCDEDASFSVNGSTVAFKLK